MRTHSAREFMEPPNPRGCPWRIPQEILNDRGIYLLLAYEHDLGTHGARLNRIGAPRRATVAEV
jgi:hypothetical protein